MVTNTPYARLVGPLKVYVAPDGEAIPDLDAAPGGNWTELGVTDGEQTLKHVGSLEGFSDNESTGEVKRVRPEEGYEVNATLVHLTLENMARVLGMNTSQVTATTSGALDVKRIPLRRGFIPERYAMLLRGGAITGTNVDSPYGAYPAQRYIPIGEFDGEPEEVRSKGGSPGLEFTFKAIYDDSQAAGMEFGWLDAQYQ